MLAILLAATAASLVASLVLGIRLLRLAARTREVPEICIGTSFIVAGLVGYTLMLAGNPANESLSPAASRELSRIGFLLIGVGVCLIYVFTWRTFRPGSAWAALLALAGSLAVLSGGGEIPTADTSHGVRFWVGNAGQLGAGAWAALEAYRYWMLLRRRLGLGLADPVVTNRLFLWGTANLFTFLIFLHTALMQSAAEGAMTPGRIMTISVLTFATAAAQWLAFFPPGAYLRWLRAPGALPA